MHYEYPRRRREREKVAELFFHEIMAENFPNLRKDTDIQIQEAHIIH